MQLSFTRQWALQAAVAEQMISAAADPHHAMLCIAAYAFLISEREVIPPLRRQATKSSYARRDAISGEYLKLNTFWR